MPQKYTLSLSSDSLCVSGNILIENVTAIFSELTVLIKKDLAAANCLSAIDLSAVNFLDSSLLALLIECRKIKPTLRIINSPIPLIQLAQAYQLDGFLE